MVRALEKQSKKVGCSNLWIKTSKTSGFENLTVLASESDFLSLFVTLVFISHSKLPIKFRYNLIYQWKIIVKPTIFPSFKSHVEKFSN